MNIFINLGGLQADLNWGVWGAEPPPPWGKDIFSLGLLTEAEVFGARKRT